MPEITPNKYMVQMGWGHVPHLDDATKNLLRSQTQPRLRRAREEGDPATGPGMVYCTPIEDLLIDPIAMPAHWPRGYALDVGWNRTAALWGAHDRETDILYLYAEHYRGEAHPSTHATAIRSRGKWIPGVVDPAARGRSQKDGTQLLQDYIDLGLNLQPAINAVESGIQDVWERAETGRLKVSRSCQNFISEYKLYRRDKNGRIIKKFDHLMDCVRYLVVSGMPLFIVRPVIYVDESQAGAAEPIAGW